tara:strand:+ start:80 stop:1213 length:1134 start_codon:yes stop_codon:yes gene_type:complete
MFSDKLKQAQRLLKKGEVWIMHTAEDRDPFLHFFGLNFVGPGVLFISRNWTSVLVVGIDRANVPNIFDDIRVYKKVEDDFRNIIAKLKPTKVYLNFSELDKDVDVLGHGSFLSLRKLLRKSKFKGAVESARFLIYDLVGNNLPEEIRRVRRAAEMSHKILMKTFSNVKVGMSEIDIYNLVRKISGDVEYSWSEEFCPIVLIGKRIGKTANAHSRPTSVKLKKGDVVYIDFGIKYKGYSSDIQRVAYVGSEVPDEIQKRFDTIVASIDAAASILKPGVKAYLADEAARKVLKDASYPDYEHSTGHPLGRTSHAPGPSLSVRVKKGFSRSELPMREGYIFTIEPRITLPNGVSIEEDVVMTRNGVEFLSPRQTKLILIK